jgi:hypothetical protein
MEHYYTTKTNLILIRKNDSIFHIYKCTQRRPLLALGKLWGAGWHGWGQGRKTCIMLNQRNNCTWQFLFAECRKG